MLTTLSITDVYAPLRLYLRRALLPLPLFRCRYALPPMPLMLLKRRACRDTPRPCRDEAQRGCYCSRHLPRYCC